MIYADNAATSFFKPETIIEAIGDYLKHPGNPNRGTNMISMDASRIVLDTRIKLADFFDCDYRHVIFTGGITESLNTVIQGLIEKTIMLLQHIWSITACFVLFIAWAVK